MVHYSTALIPIGTTEHNISMQIIFVRWNTSGAPMHFLQGNFYSFIPIISLSILLALLARQPILAELVAEFFLQPQLARKSATPMVLSLQSANSTSFTHLWRITMFWPRYHKKSRTRFVILKSSSIVVCAPRKVPGTRALTLAFWIILTE